MAPIITCSMSATANYIKMPEVTLHLANLCELADEVPAPSEVPIVGSEVETEPSKAATEDSEVLTEDSKTAAEAAPTDPSLQLPEGEVETILANEITTPLVALFQAKDIRILGTVNDPMFVAVDVANHIGDTNSERNFRRLKKKYVRWAKACDSIGRPQMSRFLTEAGFYNYLLHSKKPQAEPLQLFTYDLLSKERKRTVDEKKLAAKIEQTRVLRLARECENQKVLHRTGKIELLDAMTKANIARAELKLSKAEMDWTERGIDKVGPARDELEAAQEGETATEDPTLFPEQPRPQVEIKEELPPIEEGSITPLIEIFEHRDIRIIGTIDEPLFYASDVAEYINDDNCDRYFRDPSQAKYIRWEALRDAQGQPQKTRFLTEFGMYRYLLQSGLPKAEPFQEFTYELLSTERRKTVDSVELALKIANTKAEELARQKAAIQKMRRLDRKEFNDCVTIVNSTREEVKLSQARLFKAQMKKSIAAEREQIRKHSGQAAADAYQGPISGYFFKALREGLLKDTRR